MNFMRVTDNFLLNLPFPYFCIEKETSRIINQSLKAGADLRSCTYFIDLVSSVYKPMMASAFCSTEPVDVPLHTHSQEYKLFRVYPYQETESLIHLFLYPIADSQFEIERIIEQITSKFSSFQQEFKENKQYIDETVLRIQNASSSHQHFHNIDQLAAGIAHEIRNPLTTVSGFIQLLKPYLSEIGKSQYAEIALDELNRANQIISEFLNESKPPTLGKRRISLSKLVNDICLLFQGEATLKNIIIVYSPSHPDIEIVADEHQIKQVLVNLIKNAIEAIEVRHEKTRLGKIHIYTNSDSQNATVVIEDNGMGISDENLSNLFTPFHTTKQKGTGVGLSVCQRIMEEHEGIILVESTQGVGTSFQLVFKTASI
jgi:signal transduction histidine kinase